MEWIGFAFGLGALLGYVGRWAVSAPMMRCAVNDAYTQGRIDEHRDSIEAGC